MTLDGAMSRSRIARFWDLCFRPGKWMLSRFCTLDRTQWPILWVIVFFAVQAIPATIIRASNLEEGRIIALARGAMEDGHWITPFIYGERFAERPILASWIAALFGEISGGVTLWSLRIPHLMFFLAGALMIYSLLRANTGSKSASIFGALCWITMPVVSAKFINAEADIVLSVLLFAAFYIWWQSSIGKRVSWLTWLSVGLFMGLAALTKGPQPIAYFTLGVGAYLCLKQREQIAGFIAANVLAILMFGSWYVMVYRPSDIGQPSDIDLWLSHSRLLDQMNLPGLIWDHIDFIKSIAVEFLPAAILIGPAIAIVIRSRRNSANDLMLAAVLYSVLCTMVLVFWPGGVAARYAMPATMTMAVICGLVFHEWRRSHERVVVSALVVSSIVFGVLILRGWVAMPFWPHLFKESEIAGNSISSVLRNSPAPLYVIDRVTDLNMLVYVKGPIRAVTLDKMAQLKTSAIAILLPAEELALAQKNPHLRLTGRADIVSQRTPYRIVEIQP